MLRIVLLLSYSVNVTHEVIDEKSLDKFHDNLFKMLLTPNVISKSIAPAAGALKKLRLLGCTYGNRLTKVFSPCISSRLMVNSDVSVVSQKIPRSIVHYCSNAQVAR